MLPTKDEIKSWLKKYGHTREWLGDQCGRVSKNTVNNWLSTSISIPESALHLISRLMTDDELAEKRRLSESEPQTHLVIKVDADEFHAWERIAISKKPPQTVTDYCIDAIRDAFETESKRGVANADTLSAEDVTNSDTLTPFPSPRAHLHAAAGAPIGAEVMDWEGADDTVLVKINGLSMEPLLHDGDVVPFKHKRASRSPFMKKGLVYLVAYDGGYTVKRYNTRPATAEEAGEEWVENGKVKVLESLNPEFEEIIIKAPIEWIAWLTE